MLGGNTNADVPHTPLRYALSFVLTAIMLTVCVTLLRDPNSRLSRVFVWGWPTPLTPGQAFLCRAIAAFGIVITVSVTIAMAIDMFK